MLESLQPGNNVVVNVNYQTTLWKNLQLNLNYEGRASAGVKMRHLGSVEIRAFSKEKINFLLVFFFCKQYTYNIFFIFIYIIYSFINFLVMTFSSVSIDNKYIPCGKEDISTLAALLFCSFSKTPNTLYKLIPFIFSSGRSI